MPTTNKSRTNIRQLILLAILVVVLPVVYVKREAIADYARLYHYRPPTQVAQLANDTTMTDKARHMFYINHPSIEDRSAFNKNCSNNSEQTIVLGCYHGGESGIYIFSVDDSRLAGVEQVTAAHEMLHAAYERLSAGQRKQVDGWLQDYYEHDLQDQRIKSTIDAYKTSEPNDVVNEMHSIFGTEVATLPPQLENYYKQYFTDRSKVVQFAQSYEGEFTHRQDEVKQDDAQLSSLKTQIESNESRLKNEQQSIDSARTALEAKRSSGDISGYNAGVPGFNAQVSAYNNLADSTEQLITQYNALVSARNAIVTQVQQLQQAISSHPTPIAQ